MLTSDPVYHKTFAENFLPITFWLLLSIWWWRRISHASPDWQPMVWTMLNLTYFENYAMVLFVSSFPWLLLPPSFYWHLIYTQTSVFHADKYMAQNLICNVNWQRIISQLQLWFICWLLNKELPCTFLTLLIRFWLDLPIQIVQVWGCLDKRVSDTCAWRTGGISFNH